MYKTIAKIREAWEEGLVPFMEICCKDGDDKTLIVALKPPDENRYVLHRYFRSGLWSGGCYTWACSVDVPWTDGISDVYDGINGNFADQIPT